MLGIGGVRLLRALGFTLRQYHMNEGHSALLGLELLRQYAYPAEDLQPGESPLRRSAGARTVLLHDAHTGGGGARPLSTTRWSRVSSTARARRLRRHRHVEAPRWRDGSQHDAARIEPERIRQRRSRDARGSLETDVSGLSGARDHQRRASVHVGRRKVSGRLYDQYMPSWCHEPELLVRVDGSIPDAAIWDAHQQAKHALLERDSSIHRPVARIRTLPILGFARRMTAYKRPDLLFSDLDRLRCDRAWRGRFRSCSPARHIPTTKAASV